MNNNKPLPFEGNVTPEFSYDIEEGLCYFDSDDEDYFETALYIPETDEVLSLKNGVDVLHQYCISLPANGYVNPEPVFTFENYSDGFLCCLRLPSNAPFSVLHSPITTSKERAKALVCLEACKKLRSLNHLDKHLKPFNHRSDMVSDDPFEILLKNYKKMHETDLITFDHDGDLIMFDDDDDETPNDD